MALFSSLITGVSLLLAVSQTSLPLIAIDAGHGGEHLGAIGICGGEERDITQKIAQKLQESLSQNRTVRVHMIRTHDQTVSLNTRIEEASLAHAQIFVSIHANASTDPSIHGVEVYYAETTSDDALNTQMSSVDTIVSDLNKHIQNFQSQQLAARIHHTLITNLNAQGRGVRQANFSVLRHAKVAAVLIEIGYLSNPYECLKLSYEDYQLKIVESLRTAILSHIRRTH